MEAQGKKAVDAAAACMDMVNLYEVGDLAGKLFATFFNSSLKPLDAS